MPEFDRNDDPTSRVEELTREQPLKYCDIVMKGGITSGVVYPPAVYELSKTYIFRNIGGTSAGAIAAAVTAAAEHGRNTERGGFSVVEELPKWLGGLAPDQKNSNLFSLFQPQRETKGLFRVLTSAIGEQRGKFFRVLLAAIFCFPVATVVGAAPGLLLAYLAYRSASGPLLWWSMLCALVLLSLGSIAMLAWSLYRRVTHALPTNRYGICSGFIAPGNETSTPLPLTTWLSHLVNRAAGWDETGPPVTFGDLWGTREREAEHKVNLQMMTTNLTHGRPYRLPFEENIFYYDPAEWRELFPEEVVSWMDEHPRPTDDADTFLPLRPLPATADIPVIVAARLSLSFPVLLSAIPLYAIDYGRKNLAEQKPEKCWFSDGGIASNFPVHFFDQSLPRWPTFAINLRPYHPDYPDSQVWMANKNSGGITEWWTRFDDGSGAQRLSGFLGAIVNAMQNWIDNTQTRLPGYRDRVVHVSLNENIEGGMNLNMPSAVISSLSQRGQIAATKLVERFTAAGNEKVLSWDNHRWVRYRSTMALIEQLLDAMSLAVENPMAGDRSYIELIRRKRADFPKSYQWHDLDQKAFADEATGELLELARKWRDRRSKNAAASFAGTPPKPQPELRVRPRI